MNRGIETIRFAQPIAYTEALALQRARREDIEQGRAGNAMFLLEHRPVITLGRNTQAGHVLLTTEQLAHEGIETVETDRGGDVTYHGPGQMVAYPILELRWWRASIRWYLRSLEEILIRLLRRYDLHGRRVEGFTGVWVGDAKVAAIGVGVHNWVTFHGLALNVCPDMRHFGFIVPCGIGDKPVGSLDGLLGSSTPSMDAVKSDFEEEFRAYFCAEGDPFEPGAGADSSR